MTEKIQCIQASETTKNKIKIVTLKVDALRKKYQKYA